MSWLQLKIDGKVYLSKCDVQNQSIVNFYLSDFADVWKETCLMEEVLARAREQNKRIEFDNETIISTLVSTPEHITFDSSKFLSELELKYYVSRRPFNFKWKLLKCNKDEFMDILMKPLMLTVSSLAKQNSEMMEIIKKKDLEIEQYKLEGATLKRYKLATEKFDPDEYQKSQRFNPLKEFVEFANNSFDEFIKSYKSDDVKLSSTSTTPQKRSAQTISKHSPRTKKNLHYRSHLQHVQQKLDLHRQKVNFDDSDSTTPPAMSDNDSKEVNLKLQEDLRQATSSTGLNKRTKLSRKKIDL